MKQVCALLLLCCSIFPTVSAAQVYEGCSDIRGIPVASVASNINNVAVATLGAYGEPIIYYNPGVLSWFHPVTRQFWYFHECAHHALGHAFHNIPIYREKEADCWAVREMYKLGFLNEQKLFIIQNDLASLPGDGWVYLPGPARAISLEVCLG